MTGEPGFVLAHGMPTYEYLARHPELGGPFDRWMTRQSDQHNAAIVAAYDFSPFRTVIDVGGGDGTLLAGILAANPALRGIVFDLPRVGERATNQIAAAGLGDRCQFVAGDFFEKVPGGGDAYLLKHVIHDWDDGRARAILESCHRAMGPRGTLLIVEGVYPPRIDGSVASRSATANDVNMMVCTGGRQRSEAEFRSLFQAAGFQLTRIVPTLAMSSVIEGKTA